MKQLALLTAVLAACLLAGEGVLRWLGFGRPLLYEFEPRLFWRMQPDQDAFAPSYGVAYRIDAGGRREGGTPAPAAPGVRRVLGLGDSVLFGQGVAWGDTLAGRLDAEPGIAFVNTAVSGYSVYQYRQLLETGAAEPPPDDLLMVFVKNDVVSAEDVDELRVRSRRGLMEDRGFAADRARRASAWIHVGLGVGSRLRARLAPPPAALSYRAPVPDAAAWRFTLGHLEWIAAESERRGVPLTVAVFPSRDEAESGRVRVDVAPLRELAARGRFRLVDLHETFSRHAGEGLFLDPVHPNARGHSVAHRALAPLFEAPRGSRLRRQRGTLGPSAGPQG